MSEVDQQPIHVEGSKKIDNEETWPESLLESYGKLPLPSLYDYLLNQEKLAAEIRKQNKELRVNSDALTQMQTSVEEKFNVLENILNRINEDLESDVEGDSEIDEDFEEDFKDDNSEGSDTYVSIRQMQQILIEMMDSLFNLREATADMNRTLLSVIPEHSGFFKKSKPAWRNRSEEILDGYYSGLECIRDKALSSLADSGISIIIPELGKSFDPTLHRAVERVGRGASRCIAKVIRYGYRRRDEIIRYADVAVYH